MSSEPVEPSGPQYVEIFHSKPSWEMAYVLRRDETSETGWAKPTPADALVDAEHIREQFRVFRTDLRKADGLRLDFVITNGGPRDWDGPPEDPQGSCFSIDAPGRYVVEHGLRRVGEVDLEECERALRYSDDRHVSVSFEADLWETCYLSYSADGNEWTPAPGVQMALVSTAPRKFSITVPARSLVFAFNNGRPGDEEVWDSNNGANFRLGLPGDYFVTEGRVHCNGRCPKDIGVEANTSPTSIAQPEAAKPLTTGAKTTV